MPLLIAVAGGIVTSVAATSVIIPVLGRRAVIDVPNERSSHIRPTVRGGGIGLAIGSLVTVMLSQAELVRSTKIALIIAGIGFGLIGFADDLNGNIAVRIRLTLQLVIGVVVVAILWRPTSPVDLSVVLVCSLATIWIVSFVNVFNFMDGINGISCAEATVAGVAFGLYGHYEHHLGLEVAAFALVAGSIGFAPFNFPNARVFLGDVGSYFAGAWLAVLVVLGLRASIPAEAMVAPVALYVADTGVTLARRVQRHEPWTQGHRQHAYQRLVGVGWSHTQTTGLVFTLVALCSALGSVSLFGSLYERGAADCGVVVLVAGYLLLPELIGERRLRQRQIELDHIEQRKIKQQQLAQRQSEQDQIEQRLITQQQLAQRQSRPLPSIRSPRALRSRIHR